MIIPVGNSQANLLFGGPSLPTGAQVTFGVDNSTGISPADTADEIQTAWIATLLGQQSSGVTFLGVLVKEGPNATGATAQSTTASSGGGSPASLTPNTSVLITKNTAMGGRQGRGRFFMPGPHETGVENNGVLDSTFRTQLQTEADDFFAALVAADLPMILLRSEDSPSQPPETVTSLTVASSVATQRRRLRR